MKLKCQNQNLIVDLGKTFVYNLVEDEKFLINTDTKSALAATATAAAICAAVFVCFCVRFLLLGLKFLGFCFPFVSLRFLLLLVRKCSVLNPTTSTPSPLKILDFHDTISKSTQDLGFLKNHTRVSRILAGTCVVFQDLLFLTNASITSQNHSKRQNFGSIALDHSQN